MTEEVVKIPWIEDGHLLHFRMDRDEIHISHVECPNNGKVTICNRQRDWCLVDTFVGVFGATLNVGGVYIDGPCEIAWVPIPGESHLDTEFEQIWFVPMEDPDYKASKVLE